MICKVLFQHSTFLQLKELRQADFLLNPLSVRKETLEAKQNKINLLQSTLPQISVELNHAVTSFKSWQQEARNYIAWFNDSQTQKMQELEKHLSSSPISERLKRMNSGYQPTEQIQIDTQQLEKSQQQSQQQTASLEIEP